MFSNQNKRWSYSRFSTFEGCKLKYFYQYIQNFTTNDSGNIYASKGTCVHEIMEGMSDCKTFEDVEKLANIKITQNEIDEKEFPITLALPRMYRWWNKFIVDYINHGWTLKSEEWETIFLNDTEIVGAIDNMLINKETGDIRITDFKTPKKASITQYRNQLMLYSYMVGLQIGYSIEVIPEKIKLFVFFPLADLDEAEREDEFTCYKKMMKNFKEVEYDSKELVELIDKFKKEIQDSNNYDWAQLNESSGEPSFLCTFCDFCALTENKEIGFYGCKSTRDRGLVAKRSTKVLRKTPKN